MVPHVEVLGMRSLGRRPLLVSVMRHSGSQLRPQARPDRDALAMWKGDRVAACIAAASVIAKVTRDWIITGLHDQFPGYDFRTHKYITDEHADALTRHGPCLEHRMRFVNVRRAAGLKPLPEVH
jgi:ribonuclease HII